MPARRLWRFGRSLRDCGDPNSLNGGWLLWTIDRARQSAVAGFAEAVHAGVEAAPDSEWLWLLHDDCAPEVDALGVLRRHPKYALSTTPYQVGYGDDDRVKVILVSLVAALFGVGGGWGFYGVSGWGLLLCAAGVLLASFTLLLDFEAIKQGVAMELPEKESWRMAFGLMVTLIWLYLEFLRLLAIFSRN